MSSDCGVCGRPTPDNATICPRCAFVLDAALADVAGYQGLAYDLQLTITRQARIGTRSGGRTTETPVAFVERASNIERALKNTLVGWVRVIAGETGAEQPADDLARIAAWLRPRVGWLRHHEAGAEAHDQILDAVADARRVIDRPAERLYAGPCDECGRDLYAALDAAYVRCTNTEGHEGGDEWVWRVEDRRRWLLDSARDVLATGTEISRALTRYAQPVTPSALRGYVHRGSLVARGERVEGGRMVMLYRLGDVLDILARQAEKVAS